MAEEPTNEPQSSTLENVVEDSEQLQLSKVTRDKLVAKVKQDLSSSEAARNQWLAKKAEGIRLYWGILGDKTFPFKNCANLNVPLLRTLKETLHANIHGSFNDKTPFDVLPVGQEDVLKAQRVKKFINWQFTNEIDYNAVLDHTLDSCLLYGHAVVKCRYVRDARKRKRTQDVRPKAEDIAAQEFTGEELEVEDEIVFDGVKVEVLDPEDFLFPPDSVSADTNDMEYVIHEVPMSTSEIRRRMASGQYNQVDLDEPRDPKQRRTSTLFNTRESYVGTTRYDAARARAGGVVKHRVVEWYGYFDVDDDGIEESVMVTLLMDSDEILRSVTWDLSRPFTVVRFSPIFNTPWGEAVVDLMGKINEELNTIHNQRVDAVTLTNTPYGFFDPLSGFDPEAVELTPGLMLPTHGDPRAAVYFPPQQPVRPEMYREEELLMAYAERLVGAGANAQGGINPRRLSATEVATVDRRAGIRFFLIYKRIQQGMEEVARVVLELDQRLMPPSKQIRVMGASDFPIFESKVNFLNFKREELQGKYDIVAIGESVMDEQANKQDKMMLYQLGMTNPLIATDPEAVYNLTRDTFVALGAHNISSYIKPPQAVSPRASDEEHNRIGEGESLDPVLGENIDKHIQDHANFINSENFNIIPKEAQVNMIEHFRKTLRMKQILDQMMLMQGGPGGQPPPSPEG